MNSDNRQPKITLEQLVRVKRAERPSPEFWQQFERDLRIKQLVAIVEPRPWWAPLIRVGSGLARYQWPLGATAVVALALLSLPQLARLEQSLSRSESLPQPTLATVSETLPVLPDAVSQSEDTPSPFLIVEEPREWLFAEADSLGAQMLEGIALMDGARHSLAAEMVAASFEVARASEPQLVERIERRISGLDLVAQTGVTEETRRPSRLLDSALPTATATAVVVTASMGARSHSALQPRRTISEERLYDSLRRGARVASKSF